MEFERVRTKIMGLLSASGLKEVHTSKSHQPEQLPAGIISLSERFGEIKLMTGFAKQGFRFDIHVVVEEGEGADDELVALIEEIDIRLQDRFYVEIDKVDFYDSMLSANGVKVARFEVAV